MQYTLIVQSFSPSTCNKALDLAHEILSDQHTLNLAFFIFDGALIAAENSESDLKKGWQSLATTHKVPLIICSASADRREISATTLAAPFQLGSIGQLVEACDRSSQVLTV